jgi:hypothetical protein
MWLQWGVLCTEAWLQLPLPFRRSPAYVQWRRSLTTKAILEDAVADRERSISEMQVSMYKGEDVNKMESVFRKYPFHSASLPELSDSSNYYSGTFGDLIWHQNGDQVFVFIPIEDDSITTNDVKAKLAVSSINIYVRDKIMYSFALMDKIIPDGSCWTWETDKRSGLRYLHLDLEKRYRVINWKSLFLQSEEEKKMEQDKAKSQLFQQFMSANKGLSKLTGKSAPTEEEMFNDEDFMNAISGVPEKERAVYKTIKNDKDVEIDIGELNESVIPFETLDEVLQAKSKQEEADSS